MEVEASWPTHTLCGEVFSATLELVSDIGVVMKEELFERSNVVSDSIIY